MGIKDKLSRPYIVWLVAGICCLLWGSAYPMIKIGYRLNNIDTTNSATIVLFAGIRFIIAGVLTIIIFSIASKQFLVPKNVKTCKRIVNLSLYQTILQYLFFYLGLAYTTGVNASIIGGSGIFIPLLISAFIFKQEKLKANKLVGCLLGFSGVCLAGLVGIKTKLGFQVGDLLIFLSSVSYSFSSAFMKKYSKEENPALLSGYQFVFGGAVMSVVGLILGGRITFTTFGAIVLVYLSLVSAVAYSLWSILLKHNDVSKVAVCGSMTPIFGFILSYTLLKENNGSILFNLLGLGLVVIGIIIVNIKRKEA